MIKKLAALNSIIITFLCAVPTSHVCAQKNDYIWFSGYSSNEYIDSATYGFRYGNTKLDFNYTPVNVSDDSLGMNFCRTNTSYCDDNGSLLFYTNGIYIANASGNVIPNSDELNEGYVDEVWDPTIKIDGYRTTQGAIALADPAVANHYYLFHSFLDSLPGSFGSDVYCSKMLVSYLDMTANAGGSEVIFKNKPIVNDDLTSNFSAVRHGNGRYWWILIQKRKTNCSYRILLTDTGVQVMPDLTCSGVAISDSDIVSSAFSPDGSKYAQFAVIGGVNIYDFDRCSGELSNPIHYPLNIWQDSSWLGTGVAFSPNNRFLYISATGVIIQLDLSMPNILNAADTVGIYDGYKLPIGSYFFSAQTGPDGKIYISCGNSESDYHIISNPNGKGDSCLFIQHGLRLPTLSLCVPNFPNYRLASLSGSACDTLSSLNDIARNAKEHIIKVYPNPASNYTIVDYGFINWNKLQPTLEITNTLGQSVYEQQLPLYSGLQQINTSNFTSGMYIIYIKRNAEIIATAKLLKD